MIGDTSIFPRTLWQHHRLRRRSFCLHARQKIEQSLIEGKKALADAEKTLVAKSKEAAEIADDYVRENPWSAVGVAAGLGLILGLLIRGK